MKVFILFLLTIQCFQLDGQEIYWFGDCQPNILAKDYLYNIQSNEVIAELPSLHFNDGYNRSLYRKDSLLYLFEFFEYTSKQDENHYDIITRNIYTKERKIFKKNQRKKPNFLYSSNSFYNSVDSCYLINYNSDSLFFYKSNIDVDTNSIELISSVKYPFKPFRSISGLARLDDKFYFILNHNQLLDSIYCEIITFNRNDFGNFEQLTLLQVEKQSFFPDPHMHRSHITCDSTVFLLATNRFIDGEMKLKMLAMDTNNFQLDTFNWDWMDLEACKNTHFWSSDNWVPKAETCYVNASLDDDASSNSTYPFGYKNTYQASQSSLNITDDDVALTSNGGRISSITCEIINPNVLDKGILEVLDLTAYMIKSTNNGKSLKLYPKDKHSYDAAINVLKSIRYTNTDPNRIPTDLLIQTTILLTSGQSIELYSELKLEQLSSTSTEQKNPIKIYPNPTQDHLNVEFSEVTKGSLVLYDLVGRKVKTVPIKEEEAIKVDMSNLASGTYIIKVIDELNNQMCSNMKIIKI